MSTVQLARIALRDLWTTTFAGTDTVVMLGRRRPGGEEIKLCIGNATGHTDPEALGPRRSMDEEYDITCYASVSSNETSDDVDQQANTDACMALFNAAETVVRASTNQALGVAGVLWAVVMGDWSLEEALPSETGGSSNTVYQFQVHVRARYQLP